MYKNKTNNVYARFSYFSINLINVCFTNLSSILAGVPQGAISSSILDNIYAAEQQTSLYTSVAEFTGDKIIFTFHINPLIATQHLQNHLNDMES